MITNEQSKTFIVQLLSYNTTYYSMNIAIFIIFIFPLYSQIIAKMYLVETDGENDNRRKKKEMKDDLFLKPENDGKYLTTFKTLFIALVLFQKKKLLFETLISISNLRIRTDFCHRPYHRAGGSRFQKFQQPKVLQSKMLLSQP